MLANKLLGAAKAAVAANYIEDVFSTYLYTGNGTVQTIPNGIALGSAYGGSVYFDGTNDYLSNTSTALITQNVSTFTIEGWIYMTANPTSDANNISGFITVDGQPANTFNYMAFGPISSRVLYLRWFDGAGKTANGSTTLNLNQWYHIACVVNSNAIQFYVNGVAETMSGTTTLTNRNGTAGNFSVGSHYYGAISGYLSNVRVTTTAVYTSAFTPPTAPLTAISGTRLLTCQAPNATADNSSNAFTITVTNAVAQNGGGTFTDSTANKGGMVWMKSRSAATDHALYDTVRGATFDIGSNLNTAQTTQSTGLTSFNSNGFSIGALAKLNTNAATYASWTFRDQAKFFDVVTYTGTGANRTVSHNLGSVPGCMIVKRTNGSGNWQVYHRSLANTQNLVLNSQASVATNTDRWNSTTPTATEFTLGTNVTVNGSGDTYVAYLFAHDAGGFGLAGTDNVITCGTYLGSNHRAQQVVTLGYEPQWVMIKNVTSSTDWVVVDNMRNMSVSTTAADAWIAPNTTAAETTTTADQIVAASTGFYFNGVQADINETGSTFVYIAIRRPMKTPTSGTSVFNTETHQGTESSRKVITTNFPVDLALIGYRNFSGGGGLGFYDRLRGGLVYLYSPTTSAEGTATGTNNYLFDSNTSFTTGTGDFNNSSYTVVSEAFRRAPGFFDVVCYTGTGANRTVTHNLGVVPELMIVKRREAVGDWQVYSAALSNTQYMVLNSSQAVATQANRWNSTTPTSTVFSLGTATTVNASGGTYVAYLFATVAGVSKVGSYTGTGTTQTINCGFTAGARFVMIKRTDSTGHDWYVWDTARGIVSGNDPYLLMNSTAAEVTNTDYIDPANSGFEISSTAPAAINANGGTYIFLAIA
jgi:hypothetical protein